MTRTEVLVPDSVKHYVFSIICGIQIMQIEIHDPYVHTNTHGMETEGVSLGRRGDKAE